MTPMTIIKKAVYVQWPGKVATVDDVLDVDFKPSHANDKAKNLMYCRDVLGI